MFTPFRGTMFSSDVASSTSPPYDMIDDATFYRESSLHNMVRLLLPDTYAEAARLLENWRSTGTLQTDDTPRFYLYTMRFSSPEGTAGEARGVIGAMTIEPFGPDVLAHEETMPHTGSDRLELLRSTQANLDLIIALSPSPDLSGMLEPDGPPRSVVERDGVRHALFDLDRPEIGATVDRYPLAIADGHHRYTAALEYRSSHTEPGPWDAIMAFVTPADGSGLDIRPIHRFFPTLTWPPGDEFDVRRCPPVVPSRPGSITVVTRTGAWLLTPRRKALERLPEPWRQASSAVARELLYPALGVAEDEASFHHDAERLIAQLDEHPDGAVLLMSAVPEGTVSDAARSRLRFPRKTTLFTPKPLAGLVLRSFRDQSPA